MNSKYIFAALFLFGSFYAYGSEKDVASTPFPFMNIMINPGASVQSSYSFRDASGNTHPLIFCYQSNGGNSNGGNSVLTWPYKGKNRSANMSVTLKTNANYEGAFADFTGTLTITNNSNVQLFVNCQYGF